MAKKTTIPEENKVLWHDRKRILGMPISFTVYDVDADRLTIRKGFFHTETDEILLYRILDIKMSRTLGQKIFGVGTISLFSADQNNSTQDLVNIKKPEAVRKFLSKIVEQERASKGLIGREIYGTATVGMMRPDGDGPGMPPPPPFADVDGDGIPD